MSKIMIPTWVDGKLTPVEKLDAHLRGLKHKAVSVFVLAGRKILIQQRALSKYHTPGLWANTCCTHPEWEEDASHCAIRRLDEELGIQGLFPSYKGQVEYRADVGDGLIEHEVVEVFTCRATESLTLSLNPSEVMNTRWVDMADLKRELAETPDQFTPWLSIYMSQHADLIFREDFADAPAE